MTVIVSPASGKGKALRRLPAIERRLHDSGRSFEIVLTRSLTHGTEAAANAVANGDAIVIVGGDGLVHSTVQSVAGSDSTFAVIPSGTGNDFARALGIGSFEQGVDAALGELCRRIDLGKIGDRYFCCIASLGFDSDVIEAAERVRVIKGSLVYPYAVLKALARWKPAGFTVEVDGDVQQFRGYSVAVANAGYFGGGMLLAPHADLEDGTLGLVTISAVSRLRFLAQSAKVFRGTHVENSEVSTRQAQMVRVDVDRPFTVYADGEPVSTLPVEISTAPAALSVLVPNRQPGT